MEFLDQRIIYILVRGSCEDWEGVRFQPNSICCDEPETTLKSFSALFLLLISACSLNSDVVKVRTAEDIRFTTKGDTLYAIALAWPEDGELTVRSIADGKIDIEAVSLLGHEGNLEWRQSVEGLKVTLPAKQPCQYAFSLKIISKD